jgi:hypothetical protein
MAAIGREGGESRSAAARQARQARVSEREVPMSIARDGMSDSRGQAGRQNDRSRSDSRFADSGRDDSTLPR